MWYTEFQGPDSSPDLTLLNIEEKGILKKFDIKTTIRERIIDSVATMSPAVFSEINATF